MAGPAHVEKGCQPPTMPVSPLIVSQAAGCCGQNWVCSAEGQSEGGSENLRSHQMRQGLARGWQSFPAKCSLWLLPGCPWVLRGFFRGQGRSRWQFSKGLITWLWTPGRNLALSFEAVCPWAPPQRLWTSGSCLQTAGRAPPSPAGAVVGASGAPECGSQ